MKNFSFKSFISGVLLSTVVLVPALSFGANSQTIDVIFDKIKLIVNGYNINENTLLYNGTTYLPIRAIANAIGADTNEIYFTAGGSEADNWAIKGVAESYASKGKHIITSCIEHHAVLHTCEYLETKGYEVTYLPKKKKKKNSLDDLKKAIRKDTILITIMFANNEIGTIQPIAEIGKIAHENGILFHTDAVQAVGHVEIDVKAMNIDMLSMSGHKFYGPKGIGALYIKKGIKLNTLIHGGA